MGTGWRIRPGRAERNAVIAVACALGAVVGGVCAWLWDLGTKQMRYSAPAVRPKGARGS